jgi:hypothetical protein
MMMALAVVWAWHVPDKDGRTTRIIVAGAGLIVVSSGNLLSLPPLYLPLFIVFLGTMLLSLVMLGGGRRNARARRGRQRLWRVAVVAGCLTAISAGTWTVSAGLRLLETAVDAVIAEVMHGSSYHDVIGAGGTIRIERHRRVVLSRKVVATVEGAAWPGYLRTQVMTDYHQGRWTADRAGARPLPAVVHQQREGHTRFDLSRADGAGRQGPGRRSSALEGPAGTAGPTAPTTQRLTHLLVNLRGAVPLPYAVQRLTTPAAVSCAVAEGGIVQCTPAERLTRYVMEHHTVAGRAPYAMAPTSADAADVQRARQAPEQVLRPLRALAQRLVGPQPLHPLQAAWTLQDYFRRHYTYSLDVDLAAQGDPLVDFVLNRRPAYCEYYASGLALMLRSLGIPARVVGGFAVREYNPLAGQWIVRQRDAHAWTEVFDATRGHWVAVDATPPATTAPPPAGGLVRLLEQSGVWIEVRAQAVLAWFRVTDLSGWLTDRATTVMRLLRRPTGWLALGVGLVLGMGIRHWRRGLGMLHALRRMRVDRHRIAREDTDPTMAEAHRLFDRVARALAARGLPIGPAETLEEYVGRVTRSRSQAGASHAADVAMVRGVGEPLIGALGAFARAYTDVRFCPRGPGTVAATAAAVEPAPLTALRLLADRVVEALHQQGTGVDADDKQTARGAASPIGETDGRSRRHARRPSATPYVKHSQCASSQLHQ